MSKMRLRKTIHINILLIIIISIILLICFLLKSFSKKSVPFLLDYAETKSIELSTMLINKAMYEELYSIDDKDIVLIEKNSKEEIINIDYNNSKLNNILYKVSNNILNSISVLESGNTNELNISYYNESNNIYFIPLGIIYKTPVITDISPKIPYKMTFLGSIESYIDIKVTEYGINNSLLEVLLNIDLNINVIFPFASKKINVNKNILLDSNVIQGSIPSYYGGIITNSSPIQSNSSPIQSN